MITKWYGNQSSNNLSILSHNMKKKKNINVRLQRIWPEWVSEWRLLYTGFPPDISWEWVVGTWRRLLLQWWTNNFTSWQFSSPQIAETEPPLKSSKCATMFSVAQWARPAQIAELPRSKFDPELFPHSAYVEIFVTFATKVPYLTFCNKMWRILI